LRIQKDPAPVLFPLIFPALSHAQALLPSQWSFGFQTGYNIALSSSLNGTWSELRNEENRSNKLLPRPEALPVGKSIHPFSFGEQLAYRFKDFQSAYMQECNQHISGHNLLKTKRKALKPLWEFSLSISEANILLESYRKCGISLGVVQ